MKFEQRLKDEAATVAFGQNIAKQIEKHITGPLAI